jgi:hypothetical protein
MLEEFLRWVVGQGEVRTATCAELAADVD